MYNFDHLRNGRPFPKSISDDPCLTPHIYATDPGPPNGGPPKKNFDIPLEFQYGCEARYNSREHHCHILAPPNGVPLGPMPYLTIVTRQNFVLKKEPLSISSSPPIGVSCLIFNSCLH